MELAQVSFQKHLGVGGTFTSLGSFIAFVARMIAIAAGFIAFIGVIYAAYLYLTSAGDPAKLKRANATFLYSILGLALIVGAYWIIQIIAGILGVSTGL